MTSDKVSSAHTKRVLFIANGNGEDSMAAEIIKKLPSNITASAYPMVGLGNAYTGLCEIVGPRAQVPSEGWRHTAGSVKRDLQGGMLAGIWPAIKFLKSIRGGFDQVVVVGDGVGPLLCWLAGLKIDIYLDVFKSGYAHGYTFAERFIIGRVARTVFCRDDMLATILKEAKIDGRCAGNIMLDCVHYGDYDMQARREKPRAVTLLPGSRVTTPENLAKQVEALKLLSRDLIPDVFVAVAKGIDIDALAKTTGLVFSKDKNCEASDLGRLDGDGLTLHLAYGVIGNLIDGADLVVSQAGTATQQALGLGKPVITFNRADNRPKRMADEQALMGDARVLTLDNAEDLSVAIKRLLSDEAERLRLGKIGKERLGGPGTIAAVLELLDVS